MYTAFDGLSGVVELCLAGLSPCGQHLADAVVEELIASAANAPMVGQLGLILLVVMLMTGYVWWVLVGLVAAGVVLYLAAWVVALCRLVAAP